MLVESCEYFWSPKYPWAHQCDITLGFIWNYVTLSLQVLYTCILCARSADGMAMEYRGVMDAHDLPGHTRHWRRS